MIAINSKERGYSGNYMLSIVVSKLSYREKFILVVLLVVDITIEVLFKCLVYIFGLTIGLKIECCQEFSLSVYQLYQYSLES